MSITSLFRYFMCVLGAFLLSKGEVAVAQEEAIAKLFLSAPEEIFPMLEKTDKEALFKTQESTSAENMLYRIEQINDQYLKIRLDSLTTIQVKHLPRGWWHSPYTAVIYTTETVPAVSLLRLYDSKWRQLNLKEHFQPAMPEHFLKDPSLQDTLPFKYALTERATWTYALTFREDGTDLEVRLTTFSQPIARSLHKDLLPLLKDKITLFWEDDRFTIQDK